MNNEQSLFDEFGRRIPFPGMRVFNQVSTRSHYLVQPKRSLAQIYARLEKYLLTEYQYLHGWEGYPGPNEFYVVCESIREEISDNALLRNLSKGVMVPFICPPNGKDVSRWLDIQSLVAIAGKAFEEALPAGQVFKNLCPGGIDEVHYAPHSRGEKFEEARWQGWVIGWYFPNCLSEYDVDSQRQQMDSLPEKVGVGAQIVLSGAVEAAAAIVGSPDLLVNKNAYPHHLCLSAVLDADPRFVYSFESSNPGLWFNRRSQMLTPNVTQVSEQWAGGLTIFKVLK